jgi:hypothetical protein
MTLTPTPTSHIPLASPPPFKPRIPPPPLWPLSRWHLSSFFDDDDAPYHLPRRLPNRADSAACARFRLRKKDLRTIHTLQSTLNTLRSTHSALTLSLAATSSVLLQMSKSLAGLSHDIQTVAHASSPFSATITSTSILPLIHTLSLATKCLFPSKGLALLRHCAHRLSGPQPVVGSHEC